MSYQNMRGCFLQRVTEASKGGTKEEKLKFYITSCSFCLCNSACSLQSMDHVGHVVSESGDLEYQELELISLTLVLLFAIAQPLQTCLIMSVCVKVRHPPPYLDYCSRVTKTPQFKPAYQQLCCSLWQVYKNSVTPFLGAKSLEC